MAYDVVIWCPDRHIVYDGDTPYQRGVGGGITARVRMARALSRRGHRVTLACNCLRRCLIDGVAYIPLDDVKPRTADVLMLNTTGGDLSLRPSLSAHLQGRFRIVWAQGAQMPDALHEIGFDCLYCGSNFISGVARERWGVHPRDIFVAYNTYEEALFASAENGGVDRDEMRLVYFSHPSKGLETAVAITRAVRALDPRFHLVVFGSEALWGGADGRREDEAGVSFRGMIGQAQLAPELLMSAYAIQMEALEEASALSISEALRAGCVVIGSPVGCYPEMIREGENGFLIPGSHTSTSAIHSAVGIIASIAGSPVTRERIRRVAMAAPWSSDTMAAAWEGHWDWWFDGGRREEGSAEPCSVCSGATLSLADGLHCLDCSSYRARVTQPAGVG